MGHVVSLPALSGIRCLDTSTKNFDADSQIMLIQDQLCLDTEHWIAAISLISFAVVDAVAEAFRHRVQAQARRLEDGQSVLRPPTGKDSPRTRLSVASSALINVSPAYGSREKCPAPDIGLVSTAKKAQRRRDSTTKSRTRLAKSGARKSSTSARSEWLANRRGNRAAVRA